MGQEETEIVPVSVVALRADAYSPDGDVIVSLRTKFSAPIETIPCQLNASTI